MDGSLENRITQLEKTCRCLIDTLRIMTNCFSTNNAEFDYVSSYVDEVEEALDG